MKKMLLPFLIAAAVLLSNVSAAQKDDHKPPMKIREYWFVLLTKGPNRSQDSSTAAEIQKGHMANMEKLYNEGKLKVAGPFGKTMGKGTEDWQGIFIFDSANMEEVESLLKTDPAIAAGRLNYIIRSWWTEPSGNFTPGKPQKPN